MMGKDGMPTIVLAGNPNVGKSTVFNALTGGRQHTGNWTGKTVDLAYGCCTYRDTDYRVVDLPGCYSLRAGSPEEAVSAEYLLREDADVTVVILDATALERSCRLLMEIMQVSVRVIACINLMDEAQRRGLRIDLARMQERLGVPVVGISAKKRGSVRELMRTLDRSIRQGQPQNGSAAPIHFSTAAGTEARAKEIASAAETLCSEVLSGCVRGQVSRLDRILTSKRWGFVIMLLLFSLVLYLTISFANIPSQWLQTALFRLEDILLDLLYGWHAPSWLVEALIRGVYRVLCWVVSVMMPPMVIFFTLFTLLEDLGYLPRIAFNLDRCFQRCRACGKQALTMWMVDTGMRTATKRRVGGRRG